MFDVFNEEKITEAGLFKFMEDASIRRQDQPQVPTEILKLGEIENDIFLEIFTDTYSKLVEALNKKLKKMRAFNVDFKSKVARHMNILVQPMMGHQASLASSVKGEGAQIFMTDMTSPKAKAKKVERGALGSSMMSASSNEELESLTRRNTQMNSSRQTSTMITSVDAAPSRVLRTPPKKDHRKFDKERPKPFLDWNDFLHYMDDAFQGDRPEIVDDLVYHLTGIEIAPAKQSIREEDEYKHKRPTIPKADNDEIIADYKKQFPKAQFQAITGAFEKLWAGQKKEDAHRQTHVDGVAVLTEENFYHHIKYLTGCDDPYFGKMLYLWMSNGYDRAKITLAEFIEFLLPFKGDNKQK